MNFVWSIVKDLWGYFHRPKLRIEFDPARTYDVAVDQSAGGASGKFVHVIVHNDGLRTASRCTAHLGEVHTEIKDGAYGPAPSFKSPVELHWAHEPLVCFSKDIPPRGSARLDVCFIHKGSKVLHFFCDKRPRGIQSDFPAGRLKIRIDVRSGDDAKCSKRFLVSWDGSFENLYMELLAD